MILSISSSTDKKLALCAAAAAAVADKPRPPELATYIVTVTSAA